MNLTHQKRVIKATESIREFYPAIRIDTLEDALLSNPDMGPAVSDLEEIALAMKQLHGAAKKNWFQRLFRG